MHKEKTAYGKPVATRLDVEDYNYLMEICIARRENKNIYLKRIIKEHLIEMKKLEIKYVKEKTAEI